MAAIRMLSWLVSRKLRNGSGVGSVAVVKDPASIFRAEPDASAVRECLERVAGSPDFVAAPRLAAFLRFIVEEAIEGRGDQLKETTVAMRVFDRRADFDPRFDSIVRVQATQLRRRLQQYYANSGREDALVIEIPRGSYVPVFRPQPSGTVKESARKRSWRVPAAVAGVVLLAGVAAYLVISAVRRNTPSIAVLPFTNLDGGSGSEHVSDGFVEDLTTDLARAPGLRVVARTSAFQFRGKSKDIREIGRELGVGAVLEGSVRTEGGKVRITAQLIDAVTGYHLWSNSYEQELAGVRGVEADIRRAVGGALGVERKALAKQVRTSGHNPPPEALDAYWRGRYIKADWRRFQESAPYFEAAAKTDPRFAEAWAALASVHAAMAFQLMGSVEGEAVQAKEAAHRALELDDTIAEAHATLAMLNYSYDHDWAASERGYRRALELDPNDAGIRRGYALALTSQGRFKEAMAQLKVAQRSDPLTDLNSNILAVTLYCARRYDEAIREARRHLRMDPNFLLARFTLGNCEAEKGKLAEAVSEYQTVLKQMRAVEVMGRLGNAQARAGRLSETRATLGEPQRIEQVEKIAGVALARVYTGLGEKKQAIEWLRKAADAHVTDAVFIGVDPVFDPLRAEPDFKALCARLGLPPGPAEHFRAGTRRGRISPFKSRHRGAAAPSA